MMYKIKYGFYGNAYVEDTKTVMEHLLRTRSKAMSERVRLSTERLREYASVAFQTEATDMARELLAWRALGESPEAVKAELDRLRAIADQQVADRAKHLTTRPTPLEALFDIIPASSSPVTHDDLLLYIREARRAAGEVL